MNKFLEWFMVISLTVLILTHIDWHQFTKQDRILLADSHVESMFVDRS